MATKRGKYVREVIAALVAHGPMTEKEIKNKIAFPNEDYLKNSIISRMMEEKEMEQDSVTLKYRLHPHIPELRTNSLHPREKAKHLPTSGNFSLDAFTFEEAEPEEVPVPMPPHPLDRPSSKGNTPSQQPVAAPPTVIRTEGRMPRHEATEHMLSLAYLQDMKGNADAIKHYVQTHKAKEVIFVLPSGKINGERLKFKDD